MNQSKAGFTASFIEGRRQALLKLRDDIANLTDGEEQEEAAINASSGNDAREYEDDAQRLAMLELDGNLVARNGGRLVRIQRALQKMEEGTYGFSDASGEPIPMERLEAFPDAVLTVAEQDSLDR